MTSSDSSGKLQHDARATVEGSCLILGNDPGLKCAGRAHEGNAPSLRDLRQGDQALGNLSPCGGADIGHRPGCLSRLLSSQKPGDSSNSQAGERRRVHPLVPVQLTSPSFVAGLQDTPCDVPGSVRRVPAQCGCGPRGPRLAKLVSWTGRGVRTNLARISWGALGTVDLDFRSRAQ